MLTWLIKNRLAAFERTFDYDMSYARDILAADRKAFFAFARAQRLSRYRKDVPPEVLLAAGLTAIIAEDCGPCTQLGISMALAEGIPARTIAAIVSGDTSAMSAEVALGAEFARAVLARTPAADDLREQIVARWGQRALVSIAFAITMSRFYPTLKYALGHGRACQRVVVAGEPIVVRGVA